ncbi:MAG: hypothetical protein QOJ78_1049 [Pseudonocardiales bacterium]|jgi:diguanylate cyclase|nr:hypothetical protein [Pseudonocardiales bacterium]
MASEDFSHAIAPDRLIGPLIGFPTAADAAVVQLSQEVDMDLWLVTRVEADDQRIVASCGRWADRAPVGAVFSWMDSFCAHLLAGRQATFAPNIAAVPHSEGLATGPLKEVRCYLGVPLLQADGALFGTLCAFAGSPRPDSITDCRDLIDFAARMLSTVLAADVLARERADELARPRSLLERDSLTQLYNGHGWLSALARESERCRQYGLPGSVLAVGLDGLEAVSKRERRSIDDGAVQACSEVVAGSCRPGDVAARPSSDTFAILAVEADIIALRSLADRVRRGVRSAGLPASVAGATRRTGEDLNETWQRASDSMALEERRRNVVLHRALSSLDHPRSPPPRNAASG